MGRRAQLLICPPCGSTRRDPVVNHVDRVVTPTAGTARKFLRRSAKMPQMTKVAQNHHHIGNMQYECNTAMSPVKGDAPQLDAANKSLLR